MLVSTHLSGFGGGGKVDPVTANLLTHLDAGDILSYAGSGNFLDLTANSYDFYLGNGPASTSVDPTFNGTPGGKSASEYFSLDGGDYFRALAAGWNAPLHKNGRSGTLEIWLKTDAVDGDGSLMGTIGAGTTHGFRLDLSSYALEWFPSQAGAARTADNALSASTIYQVGVSYTDDGTSFLFRNGDYEQVGSSDTFTPPLASNTNGDHTLDIGSKGDVETPFTGNIYIVRMYDSNLTPAEVHQNWMANRGRFGI